MLIKASSGDLEHTGAGWAGLFGRLVGIGDGLAGLGWAAGGGLRLACLGEMHLKEPAEMQADC